MQNTAETRKLVAETMLVQLGGTYRLVSFVGAKDFVSMTFPSGMMGVQFKIGRGAKDNINVVQIALDQATDTYTMIFGRSHGGKWKPLKVHANVYCDDLMDRFEEYTGFYLTFGVRS